MTGRDIKEYSLIRYRRVIPDILRYQLLSKSILLFLSWLYRLARGAVLWTSSRSAVTSGDWTSIFLSWQGWCLLALGMTVLVIYMVFDLNAMILLSSDILHEKQIRIKKILREAVQSLRLFQTVEGIFIFLFSAFLIPYAGAGIGISLIENLYLPDFVVSTIYSKQLYMILFDIALIVLFCIVHSYIFTFHEVILGHHDGKSALREARTLMRKNWKNFLKRYLLFFVRSVLAALTILLMMFFGIRLFALVIGTETEIRFRGLISFFAYFILTITAIYAFLFPVFYMLMLTRLYETYTGKGDPEFVYPKNHHPWVWVTSALWLVFLFMISMETSGVFDSIFPNIGDTAVIAHRAGGTLGNENTLIGLNQAIETGADAAEIDVQRTKDGYYILNHDKTFRRLAGVSLRPEKMTLREIKELKIPDNYSITGMDTEVATLEEILDAAKGKIHLYIELKGATADEQMADEIYQIVSEKGMMDQVTFASLDYKEIQYMEEHHPDAYTGYICYASFGNIEEINVDELILEEETATPRNIERIHEANKTVSVWTVNVPMSTLRFYARNADGVITDEVEQSVMIKRILQLTKEMEYGNILDDLGRVILRLIFVW